MQPTRRHRPEDIVRDAVVVLHLHLRLTSTLQLCIYIDCVNTKLKLTFDTPFLNAQHKTNEIHSKPMLIHADFVYSINLCFSLQHCCRWFTEGRIVCGYVYPLGYGRKSNVLMKPFILPWIFVWSQCKRIHCVANWFVHNIAHDYIQSKTHR